MNTHQFNQLLMGDNEGPRPTQDDDEVECTFCGTWTALSEWREGEVPCDTCGEHPALVCPFCEEYVDLVYHEVKTRRKQD